MRTWGLVLAAGALLLAGCSSSAPEAPVPTPTPSDVPSSVSPTPTPTPTVTSCPAGSYLLTSFEGRGSASAAGKGSGGNITVDFVDGTYTIASDGTGPVALDLGISSAQLRFAGQITGAYSGDATALEMSVTGAQGDATIKGFGVSRSFSAAGLAGQLIGQSATAQVTCDDAAGTAVVVLPNAQLSLSRR